MTPRNEDIETEAPPRPLWAPNAIAVEAYDDRTTEADFQDRLRPLYERANLLPIFPAATDDVVTLLAEGGDYKIDLATIDRYTTQGYILPRARDAAGRARWSAREIVILQATLDYHREWQAGSPLHSWRRNAFEREAEILEIAAMVDRTPSAIKRTTIEDLLLLLPLADTRETREALAMALRLKLQDTGTL